MHTNCWDFTYLNDRLKFLTERSVFSFLWVSIMTVVLIKKQGLFVSQIFMIWILMFVWSSFGFSFSFGSFVCSGLARWRDIMTFLGSVLPETWLALLVNRTHLPPFKQRIWRPCRLPICPRKFCIANV